MSDRNDFFGFGRTETETEIRPPKPGRTETEIKDFEFDNKYRNFHSIFPHFYPHSKVKVHFHQITHINQVFLIEWFHSIGQSIHLILVYYIICIHYLQYRVFYTFKIPIGLIQEEILWFVPSKSRICYQKTSNFRENFGSVSAQFFAVSAETPKPTEIPISAETETEISVAHYKKP